MGKSNRLVGADACDGAIITDGEGRYANDLYQQLAVSAFPGFAACFEVQELDLAP
eukprot:SAG11_NODE_9359_length_919_cov_1.052439_1_plen_54_part_10